MTERQKNNLVTVISIVVIGIAGYVGFSPLFETFKEGITSEFLAAIFGTVFTIMITMFLLNKQTEIEEEKSRSESVFNERVELYKQIVDQMSNIVEDGEISISEMSKLQFMLVKLQMVANDNTIEKFIKVYDAVSNAFSRVEEEETNNENENEQKDATIISPDDKLFILEAMLDFSQACRIELGLASSDKINKDLFSSTKESLKKSQKAVEEKKLSGTRAEMNLAFRDLLPELMKKSQYFDKSLFVDAVTRGYPDPARDFYPELIDKNGEKHTWAILNLYPSEDGKKIRLRFQKDLAFCRVSDDYESSGLKDLAEKTIQKLKNIDSKYNMLTPTKKHLQITLSRDKMRKNLYYQTYTDFDIEQFNTIDFQQKLTDHILEVGRVYYDFYQEADLILKKLGTSMKTLYSDSRVGLKDGKDNGEEE